MTNSFMSEESFSLQILSLNFNKRSLSYITFGCFLLGILLGVLSMIHIDNPDISLIVTTPLFWSTIIPIAIIIKGFQKATVLKLSLIHI